MEKKTVGKPELGMGKRKDPEQAKEEG
jgi:hypothetical protein